MKKGQGKIVIVDGYNVVHRVPAFRQHLDRGLRSAREALVRYCREWVGRRGDVRQFWVVFDGDSSVLGEGGQPASGVRIMYSESRETADEYIMGLVDEVGRYSRFVVVSDDRRVVEGAKARGASVMSAADLYETLWRPDASDDETADKNLSPSDRKAIDDSLKRAWGIE
jgi:predicted RNA-binding protein with PIN domain